MAAEEPRFLYRGTTIGWPGNDASQNENRTCTTTDPLVAVVFAVHCRNYGQGVVHVFDPTRYRILESGNYLADIEAEVVVELKPAEFAEAAVCTIEVDRAIDILSEMGVEIPNRLPRSAIQLTRFLESGLSRHLNADEITEFNRLCEISHE